MHVGWVGLGFGFEDEEICLVAADGVIYTRSIQCESFEVYRDEETDGRF